MYLTLKTVKQTSTCRRRRKGVSLLLLSGLRSKPYQIKKLSFRGEVLSGELKSQRPLAAHRPQTIIVSEGVQEVLCMLFMQIKVGNR